MSPAASHLSTSRADSHPSPTASHLSDRILDFIFELVPQRLELFEVRTSLGTVTATDRAGRRREVRSSRSLPLCASLPPTHSATVLRCTHIVELVVVEERDGVVELEQMVAEHSARTRRAAGQDGHERQRRAALALSGERERDATIHRCHSSGTVLHRVSYPHLSILMAFSYAEHAFSKSSSLLSVMPRYM